MACATHTPMYERSCCIKASLVGSSILIITLSLMSLEFWCNKHSIKTTCLPYEPLEYLQPSVFFSFFFLSSFSLLFRSLCMLPLCNIKEFFFKAKLNPSPSISNHLSNKKPKLIFANRVSPDHQDVCLTL